MLVDVKMVLVTSSPCPKYFFLVLVDENHQHLPNFLFVKMEPFSESEDGFPMKVSLNSGLGLYFSTDTFKRNVCRYGLDYRYLTKRK